MPPVIGKRLAAGFGLAIVLLVVNAYVSFRSASTLVANNEMVVHTLKVIETVNLAVAEITAIESAQRGFIITGNDTFLRYYAEASPRLDRVINELAQLTSDNPLQSQRVEEFRKAVDDRRSTLERNLNIRRSEGVDFVFGAERLLIGKDQMDEVRRIADEMQAEEDSLLEKRSNESHASASRTMLTFLLANTLVLLLLGAVYYVISGDLKERQRAAERLREANSQLEERVKIRTLELAGTNTELERSNRELQDFAFVASHDLQEPLRKIQAFGDRLVSKHAPQLNEEARDYLQRMLGAAGRMHTLINDLLTFSRVTTKAQPFVLTDLNVIAKEVLSDLEVRVQDDHGRVEVDDLPTIYADALQMRQLFQNLIGNALKFRRDGVPPIVKIKSRLPDQDGKVVISFEDNGIGFEERYLDRIFTPFQRLHGRGEYEGTGIGLAVCRKIVERHGGTLTAESTPGIGSTFIATLPASQEKGDDIT